MTPFRHHPALRRFTAALIAAGLVAIPISGCSQNQNQNNQNQNQNQNNQNENQ